MVAAGDVLFYYAVAEEELWGVWVELLVRFAVGERRAYGIGYVLLTGVVSLSKSASS